MSFVSGANHCFAKVSYSLGTSRERISDEAQCCGVAKLLGLYLLEAKGEFVGVFDDLLGGAWHRNHRRYFGRAGVEWSMIETVGAVDHAGRKEVAPARSRRIRVSGNRHGAHIGERTSDAVKSVAASLRGPE